MSCFFSQAPLEIPSVIIVVFHFPLRIATMTGGRQAIVPWLIWAAGGTTGALGATRTVFTLPADQTRLIG